MEKKSTSPSGLTGRQLVASIFIACGIMLLGRNLGFIPNDLFRIVVSWPMLLIVLGAYSILRRQMFTGLILFVVGLCFIMPRLGWLPWMPVNAGAVLWPVVLVCLGILSFIVPIVIRSGKRGANRLSVISRPARPMALFVRTMYSGA